MYKSAKKGWYKLLNPSKFIRQQDKHMKSVNESKEGIFLEYKSSLELSMLKYCDYNKHIVRYSLEPFAISYRKPTTGKIHRYYIDVFIEFSTGDKFLVEVKSFSETKPPRKPSKKTQKAIDNYNKALETYMINKSKWEAARNFASERGLKFIILTENELK